MNLLKELKVEELTKTDDRAIYFNINPDSETFENFQKYSRRRYERAHVCTEFLDKHGLETDAFVPTRTHLCIKPTKNDLQKVNNKLATGVYGLPAFKLNSKIGREWDAHELGMNFEAFSYNLVQSPVHSEILYWTNEGELILRVWFWDTVKYPKVSSDCSVWIDGVGAMPIYSYHVMSRETVETFNRTGVIRPVFIKEEVNDNRGVYTHDYPTSYCSRM